MSDLLSGLPAVRQVPATEVAGVAARSGRVLVVLDDDPTGTQSVADLPVLTGWSTAALEWALRLWLPAVYVLTNSRSLPPAEAERRNREAARNAFAAAETVGVEVAFVSRSDSTLRGHFPLETDVLADEICTRTGRPVDGVVIVPAFGDAGRVTVDAVHYARVGDEFVPVGETEFARDATFGYGSSDLRAWVQEKTLGRIRAGDVAHISLATLRSDAAGAVQLLRGLADARPVVVDIVDENDLRLLALALDVAERAGSRLLYRVGPPFVRAVIGQEVRPPLDRYVASSLGTAVRGTGGLTVVGSHVALTTRQLEVLLERTPQPALEIDVTTATGPDAGAYLTAVAHRVTAALGGGDAVLRTSRRLVSGTDASASLDLSRRVSIAVADVVRQVVAAGVPRFVVAKGGITSSDVASRGLGMTRAMVRGPMLPGIVSLWEPMDGPAAGMPYVVFPGNVGGPDALADVVAKLSSPRQ
jgi:uncharacterized protein YgbK (DUF1537 family)